MDFEKARDSMVENQLKSRDISDERVLKAFRKVPRHEFVPEDKQRGAYRDHPMPIGKGQTISQPYMVASMTQLLKLEGDEKVLEVGTGSGYQAAILSELAEKVISIERYEDLADKARNNLERLGYDNVKVVVGDGTQGYEEEAPYNGIIVTAGAKRVPPALKDQLADKGRLVIPVNHGIGQRLMKITRKDDTYKTEKYYGCRFVPLVGDY